MDRDAYIRRRRELDLAQREEDLRGAEWRRRLLAVATLAGVGAGVADAEAVLRFLFGWIA